MKYSLRALVRDILLRARARWLETITPRIIVFLAIFPQLKFLQLKTVSSERGDVLSLQEVNNLIHDSIIAGGPFMVSRFGKTELQGILDLRRLSSWSVPKKIVWSVVNLEFPRWQEGKFDHIGQFSGFFPTQDLPSIETFCQLNLSAAAQIDLLASWLPGETELNLEPPFVTSLGHIEPFFAQFPWTKALENKKVLIVHPFVESIGSQFERREELFPERNFLPNFELVLVRSPITANSGYPASPLEQTWFDVLAQLEREVSAVDFDVAVIGAGAYGMPLAAYVKKLGKTAIHLGGPTQLLFGIRGGRWEANGMPHASLMNNNWVYPRESEKPQFQNSHFSSGSRFGYF